MVSRSRVPCCRLTERDRALTREEIESRARASDAHVRVRISISPLREFANGWMHRGTRRACLTILVSLSPPPALFPLSVRRCVYLFLALLAAPFPRFTLRFRNFPRGQNFTIDLPSRRRTLPPLRFIAEITFAAAIVSHREKKKRLDVSETRKTGDWIIHVGIRACPSAPVTANFLRPPPPPPLFFQESLEEFLRGMRMSFLLSPRHDLAEALARFSLSFPGMSTLLDLLRTHNGFTFI